MKPIVPFNRKLVLRSDHRVEHYRFGEDGHVGATLGTKDGPVSAPVLFHAALSEDSIEVTGAGHTQTWTRIRWDDRELTCERAGMPLTFDLV